MSDLQTVLEYKRSYEEKRRELDRDEGALKQMLHNLKQYGLANEAQAETQLKKLSTTIKRKQALLDEGIRVFEDKYSDLL